MRTGGSPVVGRSLTASLGPIVRSCSSDFIGMREFCGLDLYADFFRHLDVRHQMAFTLPMPSPMLLGITVNRARCDFSDHDRVVLDALRLHLVNLRRGVLAEARAQALLDAIADGTAENDPALVILDHTGAIQHTTGAGRRLLALVLRRSRPSQRAARRVGRLAALARPRGRAAVDRSRQRHARRRDLHLWTRSGPDTDPRAARTAQDTLATGTVRARADPTRRRVLTLVAGGATNDQIAATLVVSPRTVHKHLEHIYAKLGVATRTAAAARLTATVT